MNTELLPTQDLKTRMAALRDRAKLQEIEVWQPELNETLCGEYVGHKQVEHPRYGTQWQLLIKDEEGHTYAAWLKTWLRQTLKAQNLKLGDLVAITYLGKRTSKAGSTYNAWSVEVEQVGG